MSVQKSLETYWMHHVIKKIMTEKKTTLHPSGTKTGKKVTIETEKVNKLLLNIPTGNITELNDLIYTRAKPVCDKIDIPIRNPNRNTKSGWENKLEG